jgi:hypothetical protein
MIKIECSVETQDSKYLLEVTENEFKKTDICLMKIFSINGKKTIGEKIEGINERIKKSTLIIHGNAKITIKKNRKHSIISITPQ